MTKRRPLTDCPERLEPLARERIRRWAVQHLPWGDRRLGPSWGEHRDYYRARGILRADWEASFRAWLRKEREFEARDGPQGRRSHAGGLGGGYPRRSSSLGPSRVVDGMGEVLQLFRKDLTGGGGQG